MTQSPDREKRFIYTIVIYTIGVLVISYLVYEIANAVEFLSQMIFVSTIISLGFGIAILFVNIFSRQEKKERLSGVVASLILIGNPLFFFIPDLLWLMCLLYVASGIIFGVYGQLRRFDGRKRGRWFFLASAIFLVILPVITLSLATLYQDYLSDVLRYRHSYDPGVTCHIPIILPIPTLPQDSPFAFSIGFLGFHSLFYTIRRKSLQTRLEKDGTIPPDYKEILQSKRRMIANNGK